MPEDDGVLDLAVWRDPGGAVHVDDRCSHRAVRLYRLGLAAPGFSMSEAGVTR